jgi:predicted nuclease of predicted toxin-antitoxin system
MARFLIDANLPRQLALWTGGDCEFVHDIGATWSDSDIWRYAAANSLTIVTKDADFSDRVLVTSAGPSVIHVRVGNLKFVELDTYLTGVWPDIRRASEGSRLVLVYRDRIESIG